MRKTVILNTGGVRSLIALAAAVTEREDAAGITLLHFIDGKHTCRVREEHTHRQARHFEVSQTHTAKLPSVATLGSPTDETGSRGAALLRAQILVNAITFAIELNAEQLIWPCQANGLYKTQAKLNEQLVLAQHLAQLDHKDLPQIDMPLIDLTDKQLVELGGQLFVPWQLAWSCVNNTDQPCKACPGCRRRKKAFEEAGMLDPIADKTRDEQDDHSDTTSQDETTPSVAAAGKH